MKITVIIPTLNESGYLPQTLAAVRQLPGNIEVIVVDGGSTDGTPVEAAALGASCLSAPRGRALQMNRGRMLARGDVLLFLHADTRLPADTYAAICRTFENPEVIGGCFRLRFDADGFLLRLYAFFTRFSFRLFHYGDEAFFVRTEVFDELGGFKPYPIMEDLDWWLRLRRRGAVRILRAEVVTSARRFARNGLLRQQLLSVALVGLFLLGVSPHRLARLYRDVR